MENVFGIHAVRSIIKNERKRVKSVLLALKPGTKNYQQLEELSERHSIPVEHVNKDVLDKLTEGANHQGVVAKVALKKSSNEAQLKEFLATIEHDPLFLILDGVTDPHNLGACFRTADAVRVDGIIVPKDRSVGITAVVSKVACGATDTVPLFQVTNLARTMEYLKKQNIWLYGAAGEASDSVYETDLSKGGLALIMGAEGAGMRENTRKHCDFLVKLPMMGSVESLNVSVATAVLLYEIRRQQQSS